MFQILHFYRGRMSLARWLPLSYRLSRAALLSSVLVTHLSCDAPREAPRVSLPLVVDASSIQPVSTDLGYRVELSSARVALSGLVFTVAGEAHSASLLESISRALLPSAFAHPGHYQGGEVTGELLGGFLIEWPTDAGRELGLATLISAPYSALNFTFERAQAEGLEEDDPLVGHTAHLTGVAYKDGVSVSFSLIIDAPEGRVLVGAPFEEVISPDTTGSLRLRLHLANPFEEDTLFDSLDFNALDQDQDGAVLITPELPEVEGAYNVLRRAFLTHNFYSVSRLSEE